MDIILATHNKNKVLEMENALSSLIGDGRVLTAEEAGFTEDVEENGTTFEENALIKARSVSSKGCIAIADDSGLCCNALNGAPGIYSARYGGEEFVLLFSGISVEDAKKSAERLRSAVERHRFSWKDTVIPVTISLGLASRQGENIGKIEEMIAECDRLLYVAKEGGRNQVAC